MYRTVLLLILILFSISNAYSAEPSKQKILYHCPLPSEISFSNGHFSAVTNYNGLQLNWTSLVTFSEKNLKTDRFVRANLSDCMGGIGGVCALSCTYHIVSHQQNYVLLFIVGGLYRVADTSPGAWVQDLCESDQADKCSFFLMAYPL